MFPELPDRSLFAPTALPADVADSVEDEDEELPADVLSMLDDLRLPDDVKQTLRSVMDQSRQSAQAATEEEERGRPAALTMATVAGRCFSADDLAGNSRKDMSVALPPATSNPPTRPLTRTLTQSLTNQPLICM